MQSQESESPGRIGTQGLVVWEGRAASASTLELGNPWVDRDRVCGMVEQARTREQTALGWLFWGKVEGGRLGAGSREAGSLGASWARSPAGGLGGGGGGGLVVPSSTVLYV